MGNYKKRYGFTDCLDFSNLILFLCETIFILFGIYRLYNTGFIILLMVIVNGLQNIKLFEQVAIFFLKKIKTTQQLDILLTSLCFFFSMFIANDVALIIFVPLMIVVLKILNKEERVIHIVVLQTLAAKKYVYTNRQSTKFIFIYILSYVTR